MIEVDVLVKNKAWKKYIRNPNNYLKNKIKKAEKKNKYIKKK